MIFSVDSPSEDLADAAPKSREENRGGLWVSASMRVAASSGVWRRAFVRSRVSLRKPWLLQIERCAAYSPVPLTGNAMPSSWQSHRCQELTPIFVRL